MINKMIVKTNADDYRNSYDDNKGKNRNNHINNNDKR